MAAFDGSVIGITPPVTDEQHQPPSILFAACSGVPVGTYCPKAGEAGLRVHDAVHQPRLGQADEAAFPILTRVSSSSNLLVRQRTLPIVMNGIAGLNVCLHAPPLCRLFLFTPALVPRCLLHKISTGTSCRTLHFERCARLSSYCWLYDRSGAPCTHTDCTFSPV